MSLTPSQPQVNTSFNQNNGSFGTYTNARTYLYWPYPTGGSLSIFCSWNCTGNISGGSWSGSFNSYYPTLSSTLYNTQSATGGVNGSYTFTTPLPTSGSFYVKSNQSVTGNSSSGYVGGVTTTQPTFTIYMFQVTTQITNLGSTYNSGINVVLARLPLASNLIGQVYYVVNWGVTNFAGVCSFNGEAIDGFTGSVYIPQWACIGLTPNAAGTAWFIVSYYAGNLPSYAVSSVNGTIVNSPVVICSNVGAGKTVCLPNPATWGGGNMLYVTTTQSVTTAYSTAAQFAIYTGPSVGVSYFRQNSTANLYFSLLANADYSGNHNHNFSITFINDGTWWYIASVFDGQYCQIDNPANQGRTQITSPIFITTSSDGGNPAALVASVTNSALIMYMKMNHTSTSNGFVIQSYNNTGGAQNGYVCSSTANRCYKITGTLNYNAFPVIQAYWSNAVYNFPVGMYPSAY